MASNTGPGGADTGPSTDDERAAAVPLLPAGVGAAADAAAPHQTPDGPRPEADHGGWIAVGQVLGAFGSRGELRVRALSRFPQRFRELRRLYVGEDYRPAAVLHRRVRDRDVVLRLDTVGTREAARALHGAYLYVPESEAVALPPGEYFVHQIVGLAVRTTAGESLGTLTDVLHTGSNDVYVVRQGAREVLLPATREVIKQIDLDAGAMVVEPLPGLLD